MYICKLLLIFGIYINICIIPIDIEATQSIKFTGKIVYSKMDKGNNNQIFVLDGVTGETKQLTKTGANLRPKWSPDGKKIAFVSRRKGHKTYEIYIMEANGKNQKRLTYTPLPGGSDNPRWGSNNREIYFTNTVKGNIQEKVIYLDSKKEQLISFVEKPDIRPMKSISEYIEEIRKKNNLEIQKWKKEVDEDSKKINEWIKSMGGHYEIFISPDRRYQLLYYPMESKTALLDLATGVHKKFDYKHTGLPSWSKDGGKLAFSSGIAPDDIIVIYHIKENRFEEIKLKKEPRIGCGGELSWSPNSQRLVYSCGPVDITSPEEESKVCLYIFDIANRNAYKLTQGYSPDWN